MFRDSKQPKASRSLITAAAFVIVVAGMHQATPILVPFLLSVFIAVISAPPLFWLQRKGLPTVLAVLIVVVCVLGIGLVIGAMVGTSLDSFTRALPTYQTHIQDKAMEVIAWIEGKGFDISEEQLLEAFDPGIAMKLVRRMLAGLSGVLTNGFLILFTIIFILLEASSFPAKLRATLADPEASFIHFEKFVSDVQRYIGIKTLTSLVTGIVVTIWLTILGIKYPLLWGLLAFLLNYIPTIGSILAAIPAILLALIQFGVSSALLTFIGYFVINMIIGGLIEPRILGRGLGLSTLVVLLSLVFWGWVFGPVGMLLAVPLTMTVKIALNSKEDTRWIAVLLGSEVSAAVTYQEQMNEGNEKQASSEHPQSSSGDNSIS